MSAIEIAQLAKKATTSLQSLPEEQRLMALESIAVALTHHKDEILAENKKDLLEAQKNQLSQAMIDRLTLTDKSIEALASMCRDVADQVQVVGTIVEEYTRPNGLVIQKQRIPLGVIGMIFESRPNVVVDGAALAIKSGNAIILKGGKEAFHSNRKLYEVIHGAIQRILPAGAVSLIETRDDVTELLKLHEYIDLMVPRGGSALIQYVREHATMPVVAHDKGLCHMYVHGDADSSIVVPIILNAKTQRPGVCNALESLLLNEEYPHNKEVIKALIEAGVEVRGCEKTQSLHQSVIPASSEDYDTEYLDKKISVKITKSLDEAITHIQQHSSHHTEAILAQDPAVIEKFLNSLDASALVVNASTRFNDGGELGLGAELGISTSKLHAYGPMGAKEMTTTRFLVKGNGQTR
ncbi:MAG: glutamate-5-semialdehyde dehydrogenase [Bacteriovoracaceae bacterium]|nr:glutamate-5-semialdehyde dehydrogenase [Bacteriovoracaceae bacterium]